MNASGTPPPVDTDDSRAASACPECGRPARLVAGAGLCSRCIALNVLSADDADIDAARERRPDELQGVFADFEVRKFIGRGGMGAVYEAWQISLARPVAIKILPPDLLRSEDFFERFQREARMMAQMDHPNVARVFGSGITDQGDVYIVMELVRGAPIDEFLATRQLRLEERLTLFLQVCAGVQHAHQKGIIHRDLKPSNILVAEVDGRFEPKIIDFGLARPMHQDMADEALWLSAQNCLGTPAYMSPEQALGKASDSRGDIYSLGILLFEILTGHTPFKDQDLSAATVAHIRAAICHGAIPKPSDSAGQNQPARCARELRGELDAITLKALAKNPNDRYQSVTTLAEEIHRRLANEPVLAMGGSSLYLARKFIRRRRFPLAIAAAVLFCLILAAGFVIRQSILTQRAEQLAAERLRQGERLIDFMLGDLKGKLESVGRVDLLEGPVERVEAFYAQAGPGSLSPESLFYRGRALYQLGLVRMSQRRPQDGLRLYDRAISFYKEALAGRPERAQWEEELGQTWNSIAVYHHGQLAFEPAEAAYAQAIASADRLVARQPEIPAWADFKASTLHNFAALCEAVGRLDEAERHFGGALAIWKKLLVEAPGNRQLLEHLSYLYQSLAFLHGRRKEVEKVRECNLQAHNIRERLVQAAPNDMPMLSLLADSQENIFRFHLDRGELPEAESWLAKCLAIRRRLAEHDPGNAQWKEKLAKISESHLAFEAQR